MIRNKITFSLLLITVFAFGACTPYDSKNLKDTMTKKLEVKLEELDEEIAALEKSYDSQTGEARRQIKRAVLKLRNERNKIERTAEKVMKLSNDELKSLKSEMDDQIDNLQDILEDAKKEVEKAM
ncbi:MAG: hypothetical protein RJQ14_01075 [Marinoscillum sp.]